MSDFFRQAEPYRSELLVHCYRMLGSRDDAEDLVQETYLRAWRGYAGFEGRSSLRAWLYRIATTACLSALQHRSRRLLPSGLGRPDDDLDPSVPTEVLWLQPFPGTHPDPSTQDPALIVGSRSSVRLALIAALQHLPPRQRAVLILRDVLAWRATEVADLLGTTTIAVNSALRRARAQLDAVAPDENDAGPPLDRAHQELLERYVTAFENADVDALIRLLHADVTLEMPPEPTWFAGRDAVARFVAARIFPRTGPLRLRTTYANDQPAVAAYRRDEKDEIFRPYALQVLTLRGAHVTGIVVFRQSISFSAFGLPEALDPIPVPLT